MAIGEIGLDYHYDDSCPREVQLLAFERQLQLARELDLPVIIHSREAANDTMALLKKYRPRGIVHCFSGSLEMAKEVLKLDMYIGFTGVPHLQKRPQGGGGCRLRSGGPAAPRDRLPLYGSGTPSGPAV